jgi:hypothetical protein
MADKVPLSDHSQDPMAWQRAADALREIGQTESAQICHDVAGQLMRDANDVEEAREALDALKPTVPSDKP